jgi:hypothetical protein
LGALGALPAFSFSSPAATLAIHASSFSWAEAGRMARSSPDTSKPERQGAVSR